jgi:hypothetical protein
VALRRSLPRHSPELRRNRLHHELHEHGVTHSPNIPIWWLGLVRGVAAQKVGARKMPLTEAALGVIGVFVFAAATARGRRSQRADSLAA